MDPLTGAAVAALLLGNPAETASGNPAGGGVQRPDNIARWNAEITAAARRFVLPEAWIRAVMAVESAGDPGAVSPKRAMGLMQLMPETWREMRDRYGLGSDPFDPGDNVMAGTAYLRLLYDRFGAPAFLSAYNAGPKGLDAARAGLRPLPDETRNFVAKVEARIGLLASAGDTRPAIRPSGGLFFANSAGPPATANWRQIFVRSPRYPSER
jgi:soluble lytic murein transglycosylase-like protein